MAYQSYKMKVNSDLEPKAVVGTVVYDCKGYDYGLASDDTRMTGRKHISVTLSETGEYPSFTVPLEDLEPIGVALSDRMYDATRAS